LAHTIVQCYGQHILATLTFHGWSAYSKEGPGSSPDSRTHSLTQGRTNSNTVCIRRRFFNGAGCMKTGLRKTTCTLRHINAVKSCNKR